MTSCFKIDLLLTPLFALLCYPHYFIYVYMYHCRFQYIHLLSISVYHKLYTLCKLKSKSERERFFRATISIDFPQNCHISPREGRFGPMREEMQGEQQMRKRFVFSGEWAGVNRCRCCFQHHFQSTPCLLDTY